MEGFNRGTIISTAIHEAYPGHYVQFLWMQTIPSKVRKLLGANSNVEGWAHYCEQMMLDEGYGERRSEAAPRPVAGRAAARRALHRRASRCTPASMTYEQGIDFFVKEGYQSRTNGERETKRGTSNPTYLYYTLGKLEILKLRRRLQEDARQRLHPGRVPRPLHARRHAAYQDRAKGAVGE